MLTLNKTKAALQSCQCHYEKPKQIKHTRVNAGGQRMSQRNSAPADFIQPFGSIPFFRRASRPNSFIQFARLTLSAWASFSNCSLSSGIRIWNAGAFPAPFGCRSRLMGVDMCVPIGVLFSLIGTHLNTVLSKKQRPGLFEQYRGVSPNR